MNVICSCHVPFEQPYSLVESAPIFEITNQEMKPMELPVTPLLELDDKFRK